MDKRILSPSEVALIAARTIVEHGDHLDEYLAECREMTRQIPPEEVPPPGPRGHA